MKKMSIEEITKMFENVAKELETREPPSREWWEQHFKEQAERQEQIRKDHESIKMSHEKFITPFTI